MIIRDNMTAVVPDKPRPSTLGHVHVHTHGLALLRKRINKYDGFRGLLEQLYRFELRLAERRGVRGE